MVRALATIVTAILICRPDLPRADAVRYAKLLDAEGRRVGFDPITAVAIIQLESGWNPGAVSANGEDYGLAQVRARYVGACRKDADPVARPSEACRKVKEQLLEPQGNIHQMAVAIEQNRALCRSKTGSATLPRWLASYQGLNRPARGRWCRPGATTWRVIALREHLVRTAARGGRPQRKDQKPTSADRRPARPH